MPKINVRVCPFVISVMSVIGISVSSHSSYAQTSSANLSVSVADTSGAAIPDADITINNAATNQEQHTISGKSGDVTFSFLKPGHYVLTVSKPQFADISVPNIALNIGDDKRLRIVLKIGSASQTVTVDGSGHTINTTDASVSTVIDRQFVENIPLNGRSFQDLLTLAPGVSQVTISSGIGSGVGYSGDIVVNGQRTESNYFTVDGVSANVGAQSGGAQGAGVSGNLPVFTALGTTQGLVSVDALQEFRAETSTYSAEYGRSPGGQFSFSTRSGTKSFHGSVYDYLRNDVLDANNWFNDYYGYPKGKERQNDFGGTFGGPLALPRLRDNTFFFFAYEGLRLSSPQAATRVPVPESSLRQSAPAPLQPILNAFPAENGGTDGLNDDFGYYIQSISFPAQIDSTSVRMDHNVGSRLNLFGRYAETPSNATSYLGAVKEPDQTTTRSVTLGTTYSLSTHQSNEVRVNYTSSGGHEAAQSTSVGGATPFQLSSLPGPGGSSFPETNSDLYVVFLFGPDANITLNNSPQSQYQFNVNDFHTWSIGKHNLKAGIDWRLLHTTLSVTDPEEEIAFRSLTQVQNNTPFLARAVINGSATDNQPVYKYLSSFIQDEWRVSPRLSLSTGVRWDIAFSPTNANGPIPYNVTQIDNLATTQLAPEGTPLWKTDWRGIAPRIGAAYQLRPSSSHATVVRVGFGVFYDPGNEVGSLGYNGIGFTSSFLSTTAAFPLTSAQLTLPPPSTAAPYNDVIYGYDPHLRMPYSFQYNLAIEQQLGPRDSVTMGYVGSGARKLLTSFNYDPETIGNTNFGDDGVLYLTAGRASSSYSSFQLKYQRDLAHGLQALFSYTYAHSIDDASSNFGLDYLLRASSDFDIRHNFQAAVTYLTPEVHAVPRLAKALSNWGLDFRVQARSALPVDIIGNQDIDPTTGQTLQYQPDLIQGQQLYRYGNGYPGKRVINYNAFAIPADGVQGTLPRNYARAFGLMELDPALRRDIPLRESLHLQVRAEAFNVFNHPMFGPVNNYLSEGPGVFGYAYNTANATGNLNSLYESGGPRSFQFSLRLAF
jgi:Carboxypeptidase regulatory-like domain